MPAQHSSTPDDRQFPLGRDRRFGAACHPAWIDNQVAKGKFTTEDEVIVELVEQAMSPRIDWNDNPELIEAIAEIERGEGILVTDMTSSTIGVFQPA